VCNSLLTDHTSTRIHLRYQKLLLEDKQDVFVKAPPTGVDPRKESSQAKVLQKGEHVVPPQAQAETTCEQEGRGV